MSNAPEKSQSQGDSVQDDEPDEWYTVLLTRTLASKLTSPAGISGSSALVVQVGRL